MSELTEGPLDEAAELSEEQAEEEFYAHLATTFGASAPTKQWVEQTKKQCGRVRMIAFGPDDIYFYRGLRGAEYKGMVQQALASKSPEQQMEILKDRVLAAAVLWPKLDPTEFGSLYAGTKDALFELIREASNFITPESAAVLVREL